MPNRQQRAFARAERDRMDRMRMDDGLDLWPRPQDLAVNEDLDMEGTGAGHFFAGQVDLDEIGLRDFLQADGRRFHQELPVIGPDRDMAPDHVSLTLTGKDMAALNQALFDFSQLHWLPRNAHDLADRS
jgi:hypothetical protein